MGTGMLILVGVLSGVGMLRIYRRYPHDGNRLQAACLLSAMGLLLTCLLALLAADLAWVGMLYLGVVFWFLQE